MKLILVTAIVFSLLVLGGCQTSERQTGSETKATQTKKDVREIAWNSLSDSEKKEMNVEWKSATVSKAIANTKGFILVDRSFEGKEVIMVTFRNTKSGFFISKLVDEKSQKVVGALMGVE